MVKKESKSKIYVDYQTGQCGIESNENLKETKKVFDKLHKELIDNSVKFK